MTLTAPREFFHERHRDRIRVRIDPGTDDRVPLLICNGFGIALEMLDSVVAGMPDSTVIRFDAPGIGGSRNRLLPYRFAHLAHMLDDLLEDLDVPQVDIYGISWGGMLAQEFALRYPRRCRKLILASTLSGMVSLPGNVLWHVLLSPGKWFLGKDYSRMASLRFGGRVTRRDWCDLEEHFVVDFAAVPGYFGQMAALIGWTSIHRLHRLVQPVLLLYGTDDSTIPVLNAHLLKAMIPDAQLVTLDCGHLFPWTRSARVHSEISRFRSE